MTPEERAERQSDINTIHDLLEQLRAAKMEMSLAIGLLQKAANDVRGYQMNQVLDMVKMSALRKKYLQR